MLEFAEFLTQYGFPFPLFSAILSVYVQFIGGLMLIIGWKTRPAAGIIVLNFIVAIVMVHIGDSYPNTFPALTMLAISAYLALNGAGKLSVDHGL